MDEQRVREIVAEELSAASGDENQILQKMLAALPSTFDVKPGSNIYMIFSAVASGLSSWKRNSDR